jgi:DNA-directed RNA polymerase subunit alpha
MTSGNSNNTTDDKDLLALAEGAFGEDVTDAEEDQEEDEELDSSDLISDDVPNFGMAMISKTWKELEKPRGGLVIVNVKQSETETYGRYYAEPLERGYGHTLGTALKRIMLNAIKGCAIIAYQCKPSWEMKEREKQDLELNLKSLVLWTKDAAGASNVLCKISLSNKVTNHEDDDHDYRVEDLQLNQFGIFTPDDSQSVCKVPKGQSLELEILISSGYGYVLKDAHKNIPADLKPIDAMFCPVQRVDVHVSNARVGQRTDYNRLTLEVWTNGIVPPLNAIKYAADLFRNQMQCMINFEEDAEETTIQQPTIPQKQGENWELLNRRLSELTLSVRASNCLKTINLQYVGELVQKSENDMLKTKNFGKKSLNEIKEILTTLGLHLGGNYPGWTPPKD